MENQKWKKSMAAILGGVMLGTVVTGNVYASSDVLKVSKEDQIKEDLLNYIKAEGAHDDLIIEDIDLFKFYKFSNERILFSASFGDGFVSIDYDIKIGEHTFHFNEPVSFLYWENGKIDHAITAYEEGLLSKEDMDDYYIARGSNPGIQSVFYEDVNWLEDWYGNDAYTAHRWGLMTGLNKTTFGPYDPVSRAQMVTILDRMDTSPAKIIEEPFLDVENEDWYFDSVVWAYHNGIINGYDEELFGPADAVTREHLSVMLYRYAQYKGYKVSNSCELSMYSDADKVSECAKTAMQWCVAEGIITGKQGKLDPQGTAARAECAAMVVRFMDSVANDKVTTDITGEEIAAYADQFVGNPYIWGGDSLTNGIDASHFVYQILKNCGVYTGGYLTTANWRTKGEAVASLKEAQAGDIICYNGHVGIYDGQGMIIEAKGSQFGITHDRSAEYADILAIRRFV